MDLTVFPLPFNTANCMKTTPFIIYLESFRTMDITPEPLENGIYSLQMTMATI